jgi:hypothetical protein
MEKHSGVHVVDDSSLHQARRIETKRKAGLSRSVSKPDMETSHVPLLKTIVECSKP